MKTIKQLLEAKGHEVWSVTPEMSVYEAIEQMSERGIGALAVMESNRLVGMFSERDYARKVLLRGRMSRDTLVREVMTTRVIFAHLDHSAEECLAVMTERRFRHLPVMEEDQLLGMISIGDLVKIIIEDQQFTIEQLEHYISG